MSRDVPACDGETKSEIVFPLTIDSDKGSRVIGVLDLDSTVLDAFSNDDKIGLQKIVDLLRIGCDWV